MENNKIIKLLSDLCFELGLNTAHDFDGVENEDDIDLYSEAVLRTIKELKAKVYVVKPIEENYDVKGNATHYNSERINVMHVFEKTYGTLALMHFCEINAMKYRMRIGKKKSQSLKQEVLKTEWYEKAAAYYFEKIKNKASISGLDNQITIDIKEHRLPWEN